MAKNKWSKWVVGVSTVALFTTFLQLTKDPTSETSAGSSPQVDPDTDALPSNVETYIPSVAININDTKVDLFVHSRAEMQQLQLQDPEAQDERERLLANLDWSNDTQSEITLPPKVTQPKPIPPTKSIRSDRKTRRS